MLDYYHDVQRLMQGRDSASYTSCSPVHLGVMWVFDVRQVRSKPLTAVPFFVSYTRTISVIFGEVKCPDDVLMQTVTDLPGGHPILRLIAGQLAYILQERVTDSQCFMSDVETVK